jgi:hypothetical protein
LSSEKMVHPSRFVKIHVSARQFPFPALGNDPASVHIAELH